MKTPRAQLAPTSLVIFFIIAASLSAFAQSAPEKDDTKGDQTSLQGLTEPAIINGQPALRILFRKSGKTDVSFETRDGEEALVFSVMRVKKLLGGLMPADLGKLYITKTRIVFNPEENKEHYFNIKHSDVRQISIEGKGRGAGGFNYLVIKVKDDDNKRFVLEGTIPTNKKEVRPGLEFLLRSLKDFGSALTEFNQLTASVRTQPKDEEDEKEEAETTAEISSKYDRFKDITLVRTSRMLVRGNKRSIRVQAEYSSVGKTQAKPEKISLYFYSSASRPLFREDELDLNFLADEKRLPLGKMRLDDEEKTKSTVKQAVVISMSFEVFEQIAGAKKVEFQVGDLEYKMTDTHLDAFRKLLAYKGEDSDEK